MQPAFAFLLYSRRPLIRRGPPTLGGGAPAWLNAPTGALIVSRNALPGRGGRTLQQTPGRPTTRSGRRVKRDAPEPNATDPRSSAFPKVKPMKPDSSTGCGLGARLLLLFPGQHAGVYTAGALLAVWPPWPVDPAYEA